MDSRQELGAKESIAHWEYLIQDFKLKPKSKVSKLNAQVKEIDGWRIGCRNWLLEKTGWKLWSI